MKKEVSREQAEQDMLAALKTASKILGATTPRLLTDKPQVEANALRHGLTGQTVFLTPAQLLEYLILGAKLIAYLRPTNIYQTLLAQRIIDTEWRAIQVTSLIGIVHTSAVILESQALSAVNPFVDPEIVHTHAQAFAVEKQCSGSNTLEKLSRYETRITRSLRELYKDYWNAHDRTHTKDYKDLDYEKSEAYIWYNDLAKLAERLVEAREELAEKTVEEVTADENLFCKKTLRLTKTLTPETEKTLQEAHKKNLLTEKEKTLIPIPGAA